MNTEKKKLYRLRDDRMVAGVCSGLARYFEIDPTIVRLIFVAGSLLGGPGIIAYIVCLILMPLEPVDTPAAAVIDIREQPKEE